MKRIKQCALLIGVISSMYACNQHQSDGYTLKGIIDGDANGKKVYLKDADRNVLDSTIIQDGAFQFQGTLAYPSLYTLTIHKNDTPSGPNRPLYQPIIPVFLENTVVQATAILDSISEEDQYFYGEYQYDNIKIVGSEAHDLYMQFVNGYAPLAKKRTDIFMDEYIAYLNPPKGEKKGPTKEGIAIVSKIDEATKQRDAFVKDFIRQHSNDAVSLFIAQDKLAAFSVEEIDEILGSLSDDLINSEGGAILKARSDTVKKTATGATYADYAFQDAAGNPVKLSDYLGKGRYVLLEFWASWCGPCRADIPHLKEVYELYHPEGFEVISISMDDKKEEWLKAIDEEQMEWLQVSDLKAFEGELSKLYNFNGIPTCILIDPDGKIVTRNMRGSWMDKKLIELYGDKFKS